MVHSVKWQFSGSDRAVERVDSVTSSMSISITSSITYHWPHTVRVLAFWFGSGDILTAF